MSAPDDLGDQQPQGQDVPEDDGVLQPGDTLETDDLQSDPLDTGISPPERRPASERYGVTQAEAREGESLDQRLAEEEPDDTGEREAVDDEAGEEAGYPAGEPADPRAGRLVAPDEGSRPTDERTYFARDVGVDGAGAGAEEAAMHVIGDEPASWSESQDEPRGQP